MLSDKGIKKRLLLDAETAKEMWKGGRWDEINGRILITPFDETKLGASSYDLSVGSQFLSLRKGTDPVDLAEGKYILLDPGETALVLTREYIGLPNNIGGEVIPRARFIMQGLMLQSTRVDPTWYGKLVVAIRNESKERKKFHYGTPFCTLVLFEMAEPTGKPITKERVSSLGQERMEISPEGVVNWFPVEPIKVNREDVDKMVETWGPPFDIVRGGYHRTFEDIRHYVEQKWAPGALEKLRVEAIKEAFNYTKWLTATLIGILVVLVIDLFRSRGP